MDTQSCANNEFEGAAGVTLMAWEKPFSRKGAWRLQALQKYAISIDG
jgi:hypothetical protein